MSASVSRRPPGANYNRQCNDNRQSDAEREFGNVRVAVELAEKLKKFGIKCHLSLKSVKVLH